MSIQAVAWVLDQEFPTKAARAKLVLIAIANHADHTNGYCWLRADTIAREAACAERSVFRFVGALIRNGYIRRERRHGSDGRRRATDYWLLLDRAPAKWHWGGADVDDDLDDAAEDSPESSDDGDTTSSTVASLPHDRVADGGAPVENSEVIHCEHVLSDGPSDSGVSCSIMLNHPKPNPEKAARATEPSVDRKPSGPPRTYRPPPVIEPDPQGAVSPDRERKPVFVFLGTPAWEAWVSYKKATTGITWTLTTRAEIVGRWRTGWYFPSLFPPAAKPPPIADPTAIRRDDEEFMQENGLG